MIDLIRQSAVPATLVRSASKGALNLPPAEMIEILVYLTTQPLFAEQARMTLAGWDETASIALASDPHTPWEVLTYWVAPENLRPKLLPALLENSSVREATLVTLAQRTSRDIVEAMLRSPRVQKSADALQALLENPQLRREEAEHLRETLTHLGVGAGDEAEVSSSGTEMEKVAATGAAGAVTEAATEAPEPAPKEKTQYEIEHAAEIAAEEAAAKPFELIGGYDGSDDPASLEMLQPSLNPEIQDQEIQGSGSEDPEIQPASGLAGELAAASAVAPATAPASALETAPAPASSLAPASQPVTASAGAPDEKAKKMRAAEANARERGSALQKISRMSVSQRIQQAMKGSKEERFILVRDGSRLVSQAVLNSPKVTDQEIEMFASMKNVQEGVLREIARNHKFMKNYGVVRQLTNNPRTPLDISLTLMGHLQITDLKALSANKNIPDTLRKLALKRFQEKTEKKKT
jgi:hypothetical protein